MARRKRRGFGLPSEEHRERSKDELREIRRLLGRLRSHMKSPPDCAGAAGLALTLAEMKGSYIVDRGASGPMRMSAGAGGVTAALRKFVAVCVVKPRSKAAERKIHAVWR
jgi:hypothetical protein